MAATSPIARARRSTELSLIVMAAVLTAGAYTLASLGENAVIPARLVPFLAVLLRRRRRHAAAARRAAPRPRVRDDHPPRRPPRRAPDDLEHRRHRRVHRDPAH